jgi:hypothetical protein
MIFFFDYFIPHYGVVLHDENLIESRYKLNLSTYETLKVVDMILKDLDFEWNESYTIFNFNLFLQARY